VVADGVSGALDDDLGLACERALQLCRETTRAYALRFSWEAATQQFLQQLRHIHQHAVEVPASVM
jgi:hypothetical protein